MPCGREKGKFDASNKLITPEKLADRGYNKSGANLCMMILAFQNEIALCSLKIQKFFTPGSLLLLDFLFLTR